jgi:hypothetical protein
VSDDLYALRASYLIDSDRRLSYSVITYDLTGSVSSPITGLVSYTVLSEVYHPKSTLIIVFWIQTRDSAAYEALHAFWRIRQFILKITNNRRPVRL